MSPPSLIYIPGTGLNYTTPWEIQPFEAGYSLRKINPNYTGFACRLRNSSKTIELDLPFLANGDVDTALIVSTFGSDAARISKWYCQNFNTYDTLEYTDWNRLQQVYDGTNLNLDANGKLYAQNFNWNHTGYRLTGSQLDIFRNVGHANSYVVARWDGAAQNHYSFYMTIPTGSIRCGFFANARRPDISFRRLDTDPAFRIGLAASQPNTRSQHTFILDYSNANAYAYKDGSLYNSNLGFTTPGNTSNTRSLRGNVWGVNLTVGGFRGWAQENIVYNTDTQANRTQLEANQASYWGTPS
jgi:hypothetical protein